MITLHKVLIRIVQSFLESVHSCFYICSDGKIAKFRSRAMLQDGLTTKALATNCCLPEELELNHIFNEKYSVSAKVSYTGYLIGKAQNVLIKGCNTKK